ncbi:MAG: hypothetical protein D6758_13510 [Gammaproteobacteria bacterium]|nr:MAG: hypothetical protein D6758_13510 [Gammaproteobacteria bacterium]
MVGMNQLDENARDQRLKMAAAAIRQSRRVLEKGGTNLVAEVLKGQGTFYEMEHYPEGDVFDPDTHSQYYYHAHRGIEREHGHFHLFLRAGAFEPAARPAAGFKETEPWPRGEDALMHLAGISVDDYGEPTTLFVTNRWVTGETWFDGETVARHLKYFEVDHASPNWAVNIYLTALVRLYEADIVQLLITRDQIIEKARAEHASEDVLELRTLDILAQQSIDLNQTLAEIESW